MKKKDCTIDIGVIQELLTKGWIELNLYPVYASYIPYNKFQHKCYFNIQLNDTLRMLLAATQYCL